MKPREERRSTLINARMRGPSGWQDACILNLSRRGLLLQSSQPAPRGAFIEIRRGTHVVVARVMWSHRERFGVKAQDVLPVEAILSGAAAPPPPATVERRAVPRSISERHTHSRYRARATEFIGLALAGTMLASIAYGAVADRLGRPMVEVSQALSGPSGQ